MGWSCVSPSLGGTQGAEPKRATHHWWKGSGRVPFLLKSAADTNTASHGSTGTTTIQRSKFRHTARQQVRQAVPARFCRCNRLCPQTSIVVETWKTSSDSRSKEYICLATGDSHRNCVSPTTTTSPRGRFFPEGAVDEVSRALRQPPFALCPADDDLLSLRASRLVQYPAASGGD